MRPAHQPDALIQSIPRPAPPIATGSTGGRAAPNEPLWATVGVRTAHPIAAPNGGSARGYFDAHCIVGRPAVVANGAIATDAPCMIMHTRATAHWMQRPQLQPARPPPLGQPDKPGAKATPGPSRVHIQLPDPVIIEDHHPQHRAITGDREPDLLLLDNAAHPLPHVIVRMHQRRNLRNGMMASAQVNPGRNVRISIGGPSQPGFGAHLPIVCRHIISCKAPRLGSHSHSRHEVGQDRRGAPNALTSRSQRTQRMEAGP
jgi:hypothetical protein